MKKQILLGTVLVFACFSANAQEKKEFNYVTDILPYMPTYTKITPEKGAAVLTQLTQTSFDKEQPKWKFEHAFEWARWEGNKYQNDLAILKRLVALTIDKSQEGDLNSVRQSIIETPEFLRWVVVADVGSAVSDERIAQRWNQFIEKLILFAPIFELS